MLTILGPAARSHRFCDGATRRDFLKIGGMVMGGLSLPQLLAAEAQAGIGKSHKAIINVFLPGGPPHQDMWDIKVDAPAEIRGEFQPIKTNVAGIEIGECFPKIAAVADKCVFIRSMVGATGGHDAYQCMTGRPLNPAPAGGWPAAGAVDQQAQGAGEQRDPAAPVDVLQDRPHALGLRRRRRLSGHRPFAVQAGRRPERNDQDRQHGPPGDHARSAGRTASSLHGSLDRFRREVDASGKMDGLDTFTQQAVGILTSSALADALDISKEDPELVERYGKGDPEVPRRRRAEADRELPHRPPPGRSRRAGRLAQLQPLGLARAELRGDAAGRPAARPGDRRPDQRPARAGPRQRRVGRGVGRIRPHAEDQQRRRPRSLAASVAAPCSPAAACGPAR